MLTPAQLGTWVYIVRLQYEPLQRVINVQSPAWRKGDVFRRTVVIGEWGRLTGTLMITALCNPEPSKGRVMGEPVRSVGPASFKSRKSSVNLAVIVNIGLNANAEMGILRSAVRSKT